MGRPRKFIPGPRIEDVGRLWEMIRARRYVMSKEGNHYRSVNPGWAASWQLSMAARACEAGRLYEALDNPEHPLNQGKTP